MGLRKRENRSGCPRWSFLSECGPPIDYIDTKNGACPGQIYAMGSGGDRASAARLRRANLKRTTCCALSENDMTYLQRDGMVVPYRPKPTLLLLAVWVCFKCIGEARIPC